MFLPVIANVTALSDNSDPVARQMRVEHVSALPRQMASTIKIINSNHFNCH